MVHNCGDVVGFPEAENETQLADAGRLAGLFCRLHRRRFTGVLHVETPVAYSVFSFRDGAIVFVEESTGSASVADQMLAMGLLTREQFADVVSHMTDSLVDNEDVAFCEQAVALGHLAAARAAAVMSQRVRAKVIQAMNLSECRTEFDEGADALADGAEYPQDVGALVYIGVRTFYDDALLAGMLPDPSKHYMRLLAPQAAIATFFALDDDETAFLRSLDAETKVAAFLRSSLVDHLHALQMLGLFRIAGMAEFATTPYAAAPEPSGVRAAATMTRERTHHPGAIARGERGASVSAREERPFGARGTSSKSAQNIPAQVRTSAPEAARGTEATPASTLTKAAVTAANTRDDSTAQALAEAKARASRRAVEGPGAAHRIGKQLEKMRVRAAPEAPARAAPTTAATGSGEETEYAKAHLKEILMRRRQVSGNAKVPAAPAPKRDPAQDLKQAQDLLRAQQFGRAQELLRGAVEQAPADEVLRTYHLWAKVRSVAEPDDEQVGELRDLARKLAANDDHGAFACYVLGHLAFVDKKDDAAEKFFRKAFTRDKTMKDAERHLLILERRKQIHAQEQAASNRKIFGITISSTKKDS